jgi:hypothetical protein
LDPVLAVVRGEAPVSSIKGHSSAVPIRPALADIAAGIRRYGKRKGGAKGWAQLLIRSDLIDIEPAGDSPDWDTLLSAIWDASSGAPLAPGAIAAADRICASDVIPS